MHVEQYVLKQVPSTHLKLLKLIGKVNVLLNFANLFSFFCGEQHVKKAHLTPPDYLGLESLA